MLYLNKPSEARILGFLANQEAQAFSYPDVGCTAGKPPRGYTVDHHRTRLGEGRATFEQAVEAVKAWKMSRVGWLEIWPRLAPVEDGENVAVLARVMIFWWMFACRVVHQFDEPGELQTAGFAYGTLPGNLLDGEERFTITWDHRDDSVWYDLMAYSRPASFLGWLARPIIRRYQHRFAPYSMMAMNRASIEG